MAKNAFFTDHEHGECGLKRCCLGFFITVFFLQACQTHQTREPEAALYNMQLGLAYLNQGALERAKHKLLTALHEAPRSPAVNASMAYFLEKTGDIERARHYYRKALRLAPHDGAQLNNYGAFLCRQGAYQSSISYFLKAAHEVNYEHTAGAYENAGLCAEEIPDYVHAKEYFAKALKADPSRTSSRDERVKLAHQVEKVKLDHPLRFPKRS
jgi:type IV pilus assembly protein PilF